MNLQPSGKYLMEDFYYAGGLPAVMREIAHVLDGKALTANGKTMGENIADAPCWNRDVIKPFDEPFKAHAGIAVLRGNLAPDGAVIKPSAASPHLLKHRGPRGGVREHRRSSTRASTTRISTSTKTASWCSRAAARRVIPGMAEVGNMPLPPKLLRRGITDMVRISDARMSGTAYGTVVLHVSPEAAAGGPLALVRNGDIIEVDVPARRLHLDVSDAELAQRRAAWKRRADADARLVQAVRRSRAAGAPRRGPGRAGRRQRRRRHARQSLKALTPTSENVGEAPPSVKFSSSAFVDAGQGGAQFDELRRLAQHLVHAGRNIALGDQAAAPAGEHQHQRVRARWP